MSRSEALIEAMGRRFGLVARPDWPERVAREIEAMGKELELSPSVLQQRLHLDVELIRSLAGRLTVEETFFFRQSDHFSALLGHLAQRLGELGPGEQVCVWSAGCAGGDEPYSLAMAMAERWSTSDRSRVELLATDVNLKALQRARSGRYRKWSFRSLEPARISRYFDPVDAYEYRLCADIRRRVRFVHLSLQEHAARMQPESLDAVLFRNVAVYLNAQAIAQLYECFARVLRADGWLLVAGSDRRPPKELFVAQGSADMTVYRRRSERATDSVPRGGLPGRKAESIPRVESTAPQAISVRLERARRLASQGAYERALTSCNETIQQMPRLPAAYQLRGEVLFHCERFAAATRDFQRAMQMAESDMIAHYWYVVALQAAGHHEEALREATGVVRRISTLANDVILSDGQTTAGELLSAARFVKQSLD